MIVYIFGGERLDYLNPQLRAIQKWVKDLTRTVYVQGPCFPLRSVSNQSAFHDMSKADLSGVQQISTIQIERKHVRPAIKTTLLAAIVDHVFRVDKVDDEPKLFLHGDMFPFAPVDADQILGSYPHAGPASFSLQWFLTTDDTSFKDSITGSAYNRYPATALEESQQKEQFGQLVPGSAIFEPSFLHLDGYSTDFDLVVAQKRSFIQKFVDEM